MRDRQKKSNKYEILSAKRLLTQLFRQSELRVASRRRSVSAALGREAGLTAPTGCPEFMCLSPNSETKVYCGLHDKKNSHVGSDNITNQTGSFIERLSALQLHRLILFISSLVEERYDYFSKNKIGLQDFFDSDLMSEEACLDLSLALGESLLDKEGDRSENEVCEEDHIEDFLARYCLDSPSSPQARKDRVHIEYYLLPILSYSLKLRCSFWGLLDLIQGHEVAHFITHLGRDADGSYWRCFRGSSRAVIEGVAQDILSRWLSKKSPRGLHHRLVLREIFNQLLSQQSGPYRTHLSWEQICPSIQLRKIIFQVLRIQNQTLSTQHFAHELNTIYQRVSLIPVQLPN